MTSDPQPVRRATDRPSRPLLVAAALVLGAGLAWHLLLRHPAQRIVEAHFANSPDPLALALTVHRVHVYGVFLVAVAIGLAILAAALGAGARWERTARHLPPPWLLVPLLLAVLALLAAGGSEAEWRRFGSPCWDDYCGQADVYRAWISRPSAVTWAAVSTYLREGLHSNSPLAPLLTGLLGALSGAPTVIAYRAVMGLATAGTLVVFWFLLLPRAEVPPAARLPALVLLATSLVLVRSALFPQTDALLMLWVSLALALALERTRVARRWHWPVAFALLVTGLLVKVSFLPALALIPLADAHRLWAARHVGGIRPLHALGRLGFEVLLFAALPYLAFRALQSVAGSSATYARELAIAHTADSWLPLQMETFLQAALIPLVLFAAGWAARRRVDLVVAAWVGVYLLALLAAQASGFDRYQLPLLPALALLAARGFGRLSEEYGMMPTWLTVALIATINYLALGLGLYF